MSRVTHRFLVLLPLLAACGSSVTGGNDVTQGPAGFSTHAERRGADLGMSEPEVFVGATKAELSWTTDVASHSQVTRMRNLADLARPGARVVDPDLVLEHRILLEGLVPNSKYFYEAFSCRVLDDDLKNDWKDCEWSGSLTFTTLAQDPAPPVISDIQIIPQQTSASVRWTTDDPARGEVAYDSLRRVSPALATRHEFALTDLRPATPYAVEMKACTAPGICDTETRSFQTLGQPVVEGCDASSWGPFRHLSLTPGPDRALVTWENDYDTTGTITYGRKDQPALGTISSPGPASYHSKWITALTPDTDYWYEVTLTDARNRTHRSCRSAFRTAHSGAHIYYVDPAGSDTHPGTQALPWLHPMRACKGGYSEYARPGDVVLVNPGTYPHYPGSQKVLSCYPPFAGTEAERIYFKANGARASVVFDNDISLCEPDSPPIVGTWTVQVASYTTVDGFTIFGGHVGLRTDTSEGVTFRNNDVYHTISSGILTGKTAYVHTLNNYVHDRKTDRNGLYHRGACGDDGPNAAIYAVGGSHPTIEYENHIARGNMVYNWHGTGISFNPNGAYDNHCAGILAEDNIVFNISGVHIGLTYVYESVIRNNVLFDMNPPRTPPARGLITLMSFPDDSGLAAHDNVITGNTLVANQNWSGGHGIEVYGALVGNDGKRNREPYNNYIFNNLIVTPKRQIYDWGSGLNHISASNLKYAYSDTAAFHAFLDTVFADWRNRDFRLKPGSPAIDAGEASFMGKPAPMSDMDGQFRPFPVDGLFDVGAFEYRP